MHRRPLALGCAALAVLTLCALFPPSAAVVAAGRPGGYREGEQDLVRNINPPGQTGFLSLAEGLREQSGDGYTAPHQDDQQAMYASLAGRAPGSITAADVAAGYKDASFGVPAGQVASVESPPGRPGASIIRDRQFGVPHIYAATDDDLVFATGWVLGEDRLFMADVLRHYGRSTLAGFIGADGIQMDCDQAQLTGYSEAELDAQVNGLPAPYPHLAQAYVDGINAYIDSAVTDPRRLPAEYAAFGPPRHFNVGDIIAIAGLVGGIFGKGGGLESRDAAFLRALYGVYGHTPTAQGIFRDFMETLDPAAPTTIDDTSMSYEDTPQPLDAPGAALTRNPPPSSTAPGGTCSVQRLPVNSTPGGVTPKPPTSAQARLRAAEALGIVDAFAHVQRKMMSNALLVDAAHSTTGRPIAVFGPQVAYFDPEILMEEDLHSPSFDVRGVSFPGTNFVVELGHGPDYAWSATSAGTDNIDQFAELLCNPTGGAVDPASTYYMHDGRCTAMSERTEREVVPPSAGSTDCAPLPPCGPALVTMRIERTVHGPVLGRTTALVEGREVPVAIATQRSTFMHEADSVTGFAAFDNPAQMRDAHDFLAAAASIDYTFNWFYVDDRDIAYYQSGLLPERAAGVNPDLPTWGTGAFDWRGGWDWTTRRVGASLPVDAHCHAVDPPKGWMTSWNNKGCPRFRASDDQWSYGQVFRSQSLSEGIARRLAQQGGRMGLVDLVNVMESAATTDLKATQTLGLALQVIGDDPRVASQVALLRQWLADGGHRRVPGGQSVYQDVQAIQLMNAWWLPPRDQTSSPLLHAVFDPALGAAFAAVPEQFTEEPYNDGADGDGYIEGWYGYVQKSLQMALGMTVAQPYSQAYCGGGSLAACRSALVASLQQAARGAAGGPDAQTTASEDDIAFKSVGLGKVPPMHWQNRPTFQQVVDIPGHRPRGGAVAAAAMSAGGPTAAAAALPNTAGGGAAPATALLAAVFCAAGGLGRRRRHRGASSRRPA